MRLPPLSLAALALPALAALPTSRSTTLALATSPLSAPPARTALLPLVEHTAAPAQRMGRVRRASAPVEDDDGARGFDSAASSATAGSLGAAAGRGELSGLGSTEMASDERVAAAGAATSSASQRRTRSTTSSSRAALSPSPASPSPVLSSPSPSPSTSTASAPPTALAARALLSAPLPGRTLAVRPVGLAFTSALLGLLLAVRPPPFPPSHPSPLQASADPRPLARSQVIAYIAYERVLYRRQFRARRAEEAARRAGERERDRTRARAAQVIEMRDLGEGGGGAGR